ncbi:unnamed protein product, partial [Prorocentrum cordatum]
MPKHLATSNMRKAELLAELAQWDEDGFSMRAEMLRARHTDLVTDAKALGCVLDGKKTRGDLQILGTERHELNLARAKGCDPMPFGRHQGKTIWKLLERERGHARCMVSMNSYQFQRITDWLVSQGATRSMREKSSEMDTNAKTKEEQIIDLLGDVKMAMSVLTTRVQKVE